MVGIDIEEIRRNLEELHQHNIVFEELEEGLFEENIVHNYDYARLGSVISEIKEKQDIVNKLKSLNHNVGLLKNIVLAKNHNEHQNFVIRIIENNLSFINSIITDMSSLKDNLHELEKLNRNLLSSKLPLDIKILLEQNFERKHKKLNEIYVKQKSILVSLSSVFIKLAKKSAFDKR